MYDRDMGRWCAYRRDTWYTGDLHVAPDAFFVMPRSHARLALGSSLQIAIECDVGQACCNSSNIFGRSLWVVQYWGQLRRDCACSTILLGSGTIARNPFKPGREGKKLSNRDCTLHLGCW